MKKKVTFITTLPLIYLISILPERTFYGFSDFIAFLLRDLFAYRKEIILRNLRASFPKMSPAEINNTMIAFYSNLSDTLLESFKMRTMSKADISRRFHINGLDKLKEFLAAGRTVICVTGHYANWEWGGLAISAASESPVLLVYQPMSNQYHERYFNGLRSRFGSVMVPVKNVLRQVIANKDKPLLMVLVADQSPSPNEKNPFVRFLNQDTSFFNGPEKIVRKINGVLIFAEVRRTGRGFYEVDLVPLIDEPAVYKENEITRIHVGYLEKMIRNKPQDWLWSHRRWKGQVA